MYGGPFYSAGYSRIVNGQTYHVRGVHYAHWVSLMNGGRDPAHYQIRRGRAGGKLVHTAPTREAADAWIDAQAVPAAPQATFSA